MNLRRGLRGIGFSAALAALACSSACSNSSSGPSTGTGTSTTPTSVGTLVDEYESVGDVPLSGGISEITFEGGSTYSLRRLQGPNAAELIGQESGTYALSADGTSITLTPTGKPAQSYPFKIVAKSSSASAQSAGLHLNGLGDILQDIFSFVFNGQTFQSDGTVPDPSDTGSSSGDGDDAGTGSSSGDDSTGDDAGSSSGDDSTGGESSEGTSSDGTSSQGTSSQASSGQGSGAGSSNGSSGAVDAGTGDSGCTETPAPVATGNGVDVSHYQGTITWPTVKAAKSFAYAKATEGTSYTDTKFATYFSAMKAAGISRGAYHFFRASKSGKAQADYFAAALLAHGFDAATDLPPMLDLEVTDGVSASTVVTQARAFLAEAQAKLGVTMILYTGPSFFISTLGNPDFSANPLWIAQYTSASKPKVPSHWSNYTIWQFSETIHVNGISSTGADNDRWQGASAATDAGAVVTKCPADAGPKDAGSKDAGQKDATSAGDGTAPDAGGGDAPGSDAQPLDASIPNDGSLIPGTCTHDVCTAGEKLGQACNSCTDKICAVDPYCCDTLWGPSCFPDVAMYCGMTCE